jgi:hypothetical protein
MTDLYDFISVLGFSLGAGLVFGLVIAVLKLLFIRSD